MREFSILSNPSLHANPYFPTVDDIGLPTQSRSRNPRPGKITLIRGPEDFRCQPVSGGFMVYLVPSLVYFPCT